MWHVAWRLRNQHRGVAWEKKNLEEKIGGSVWGGERCKRLGSVV